MAGREGLDEAVERAWREFRVRLADRLAELRRGGFVDIELDARAHAQDKDHNLPYVEVTCPRPGVLRALATGNEGLDPRFGLDDAATSLMLEMGWRTTDGDPADFGLLITQRFADRLAVLVVRALREVYGCLHPELLDVLGLDLEPAEATRPGVAEPEAEPEPIATYPEDADELRELVLGAVTVMLGSTPAHSADGRIPIRCGRSVVLVSVQDAVPVIELRAVLAAQVPDPERARNMVAALNERFDLGTFVLRGDRVVMKHYLPASPFAPAQLRLVLSRMCEMVDVLAGEVVAEVGGRRHLDPPLTRPVAAVDEASPLAGLLELLHDGSLQPRMVAALFGNRRQEITAQLVRLRTGRDLPGDHDLERVLAELRAALRFVAERDALPPLRRMTPARRPRSQQLSLISGDDAGEEVLDLGGCAG